MKLKNNNTHSLLIVAVSFSLLSPVAHADWGVGIGIDNERMLYEEDEAGDINLNALFNVKYQGDKFNIDKSGLSYDLIHTDKIAVEALATLKNLGVESGDLDIFKGMDERKGSVDLGGRAIIDTGILGQVVVDVTKDVNSSKGTEASIKLGGIAPHAAHWTGERKLNVAAVAGLRYQSAKVVDYYYGVKNTEATASRSAYKGKSATTPFVGFEAQANLTPNITIDGGLGVSKAASSIRNSSLTDNRDHHIDANVGFTYWF